MPDVTPPILPAIVGQHIEGAAELRATRSLVLRAPQLSLFFLARHDERIRAHLDGLAVAGDVGFRMAQEALEEPGVGSMFVLAVAAIERRDRKQIDRLLALLGTVPDAERALASAFGWVSAELLRGFTAPLLASADPRHRWLGIAACAAHGVDPGPALAQGIEDPDERVRARSLRAAGRLGKKDLLQACLAHIEDPEPNCRFQAARSAMLLGRGPPAAAALESIALQPEQQPHALDALRLALLGASGDRARTIVRQLAAGGALPRKAVQAAGWAGDVAAVGWLIRQMGDDILARVAGEAFTFITGADLAALGLERDAPQGVEGGPTENPEDENVEMDPDDGLPWPDVEKVRAWWQAHQTRFSSGVRHFLGEAPSVSHCRKVLREGFQRQRIASAEHLCLLQPGTPLFNIAAPAWRQQRWLNKP